MTKHPNESSLLYGCNGEVTQRIQYSESIFISFILILMILIAIYGNLLVILAILKNQKLRMPRNSLLCSLAFIDLLSPLVRVLPIAISTIKGRWVFGCICCAISSATGVFFCSASILHMCAITIERYITIRNPLRSKVWMTQRKTNMALGFIWLLALMMGLIPSLTSHVSLYFNDRILLCDYYLVFHPKLSLLMALLYFCLPNVLMVIVYQRIYRKIVVNNKMILSHQADTTRHGNYLNRRIRQEWKAVKMVIVVVGMFIILWLPYFSVTCVKSYYPDLLPSWVERFAITCAYLNSCCNFIVYSVMNKKLRSAFKELIPSLHKLNAIYNYVSRILLSLIEIIRRNHGNDEEVLHFCNFLQLPDNGVCLAVINTEWHDGIGCNLSDRSSVLLHGAKDELNSSE
jgi:hypothetical protein